MAVRSITCTLWILALSAAACQSSGGSGGLQNCNPDGTCPAGYVCRQSDNEGVPGTGGTDAHPVTIDVRPPDAMIVLPPPDANPMVPDTTITAQPPALGNDATVMFTFTSSINPATFACSLDGAAFAACTSPFSTTVADGAHTFAVRATAGGETDATPATRDVHHRYHPAGDDHHRGDLPAGRQQHQRQLQLHRERARDLPVQGRHERLRHVHLAGELHQPDQRPAHVHRPGHRPRRQRRGHPADVQLDRQPDAPRHPDHPRPGSWTPTRRRRTSASSRSPTARASSAASTASSRPTSTPAPRRSSTPASPMASTPSTCARST